MKRKIKNVIFDWSGVVKDVYECHFWIVSRMFKALGMHDVTLEKMKQEYEEPYMNFWRKFSPNITLEEEIRLYKESLLHPDCPQPKACDGIVDLIKKLKKAGVKMVILSADHPESLFPEIKKFGLEGFFKEIDFNVHDKAEVIHDLMKRNNFRPEETIFIGDTNNEILAGKAAGVKTIAVTWGLINEEKLSELKPDFLVRNSAELEEILLP